MISIKSPQEIEIMATGGRILAKIRDQLVSIVKPGITTYELDQFAYKKITESGGYPSFLHHSGFPASICTSVNDEVVHGIPGKRILKDGDTVGIDIGMKYKDFHNDTAITVPVGQITLELINLLDTAKAALAAGIQTIKPNIHLGDVQNSIQKVIEKAGYGIVRDLTGHGVGRELQEEPAIANFGNIGTGPILKTGMVIALEPMITLGKPEVTTLLDGWTVVTVDRSPTAHFEHTVAVTDLGGRILTQC
ncbi:MAG: type I methionyl aminopeptidase [bacterium]|nr:type I methionyl aminopeptidase [bacterium]